MKTVDEIFNILRMHNQFFYVEFERRTDSKNSSAKAGDIRKMLCRTNMNRFKKGIVPDAKRDDEDFKNGVLTVFSVNDYHKYVKDGMNAIDAGYNSWRRIDLVSLVSCSVIPKKEIPPAIRMSFHKLSNRYRLDNIPGKELS